MKRKVGRMKRYPDFAHCHWFELRGHFQGCIAHMQRARTVFG